MNTDNMADQDLLDFAQGDQSPASPPPRAPAAQPARLTGAEQVAAYAEEAWGKVNPYRLMVEATMWSDVHGNKTPKAIPTLPDAPMLATAKNVHDLQKFFIHSIKPLANALYEKAVSGTLNFLDDADQHHLICSRIRDEIQMRLDTMTPINPPDSELIPVRAPFISALNYWNGRMAVVTEHLQKFGYSKAQTPAAPGPVTGQGNVTPPAQPPKVVHDSQPSAGMGSPSASQPVSSMRAGLNAAVPSTPPASPSKDLSALTSSFAATGLASSTPVANASGQADGATEQQRAQELEKARSSAFAEGRAKGYAEGHAQGYEDAVQTAATNAAQWSRIVEAAMIVNAAKACGGQGAPSPATPLRGLTPSRSIRGLRGGRHSRTFSPHTPSALSHYSDADGSETPGRQWGYCRVCNNGERHFTNEECHYKREARFAAVQNANTNNGGNRTPGFGSGFGARGRSPSGNYESPKFGSDHDDEEEL